jgi:hypothetical protein
MDRQHPPVRRMKKDAPSLDSYTQTAWREHSSVEGSFVALSSSATRVWNEPGLRTSDLGPRRPSPSRPPSSPPETNPVAGRHSSRKAAKPQRWARGCNTCRPALHPTPSLRVCWQEERERNARRKSCSVIVARNRPPAVEERSDHDYGRRLRWTIVQARAMCFRSSKGGRERPNRWIRQQHIGGVFGEVGMGSRRNI